MTDQLNKLRHTMEVLVRNIQGAPALRKQAAAVADNLAATLHQIEQRIDKIEQHNRQGRPFA